MSKEVITRRDLIKNLVAGAITLHGTTKFFEHASNYVVSYKARNSSREKIDKTSKSEIDREIADAIINPNLKRSANGLTFSALEIATGITIIPDTEKI